MSLAPEQSPDAFRQVLRLDAARGRVVFFAFLTAWLLLAPPARAGKLTLPPEATQGLHLIYSGDPDSAIALFRKLQQEQPDHPLGYLLEVEARWWKIYCASCEIKWNMIDAWHRARLPEDDVYLSLTNKAAQAAQASLQQKDTAEMRLYAGLAYLLRARLLGLRDERRGTARAGVRAREHLLRAIQLDPDLDDAYTGLGLYNYYADTLSALAKILRFFMGIPGGSKREGLRQLERAMSKGELTQTEARFYLAKNLRNYDRRYERAGEVLMRLVDQFPQNPIFHLLLGDINAKLNRREKAATSFRAAAKLSVPDPACQGRVQQLAREALAALGPPFAAGRPDGSSLNEPVR